jgi:hypothetical protein
MINFIKKSIVALSLIVVVTSCDKSHDENFALSQDPKSVGFNYANTDLNVLAITPTGTSITVDMGKIFLSSPATVDEEITVKVIINNTLISDYNTTNSTNYVNVPATNLQLPLTYTISKGQLEVPVIATINLTGLDLSKAYAIGISIASVVGRSDVTINRTYENLLFATIIKNRYDGRYSMNGIHTRPIYLFPYTDVEMHLITTGSGSVKYFWVDADADGHPFATDPAGTLGWYGGAVSPNLTFDLTTNNVTSANNLSSAVAIDLSVANNPNPKATINSTTGKVDKIYVAFRYSANDARAFIDTLTYLGPR